ncbi:hypothetical protein M9H77_19836 [Catharanthus roseus]|uniref:Uncharacterized protein n=1 Tax=Catharanthus roseus TaxID=4058 RepID=A0ACC0BBQ7_CATRO|nr:hypothetical protein M9H77_19836 [Catharanthus roseus]
MNMAILGVGVSSSRLMVSGVAVVPGIRYIRKLITTTTPPPPIQEDQLRSDPAVAQERPVGDEDEVYDTRKKAPRLPNMHVPAGPSKQAPGIGPVNKGPPRPSSVIPNDPPV